MTRSDAKSKMREVAEKYRSLTDSNARDAFLFNGYVIDEQTMLKMSDHVKRVKALKEIEAYRKAHDAEFFLSTEYGTLPEASIAVYDLSSRVRTKAIALKWCISKICEYVNPLEVYMYNPLGKKNDEDGYKWYSGQRVIVYQIHADDTSRTLLEKITSISINGYDLMDPSRTVKKVIFVVDDWCNSEMFFHFNLGIDDDDYMKLFDDAWKGLKHEWTTRDGIPLTNYERQYGCCREPSPTYSPVVCKGKKPRLRKPKIKKSKKDNRVWLIDRTGTKSARFSAKLLFPYAKGPIF